MLTKNIMQRCYKFNNIKNHPWFANFSWDSLINMSLDVPMKPKLKPDDLSKKIPFNKYVKVSLTYNKNIIGKCKTVGKSKEDR